MEVDWHDHHQYIGQHAFLSPSKMSWLNYDDSHLIEAYKRSLAAQEGTREHAFAAEAISLRHKLSSSGLAARKTINHYVNDAISMNMRPEQPLVYSENCFGTTDAISFRDNFLRIHDLKTGTIPAHMEQLLIYAALFCLEYNVDPHKLNGCELRIYQNDEVYPSVPDPSDIRGVMDKIIQSDKILRKIQAEEGR